MAIALTCQCGREFEFADKFAGQSVRCPDCNRELVVPAAAPRTVVDLAFEHDKYLISQKIRIDAKYSVTDEQGNPVLFVIRPSYLLRSLGAVFAGVAAGVAVGAGFIALADMFRGGALEVVLALVGMLGGFAAFLGVALALSKKRHTDIFRDESGGKPFVTIQ